MGETSPSVREGLRSDLNIVHVTQHYYPNIGGIETVVRNIAEEQARQGDDVYVVTRGANHLEETLNDVRIHRIRGVSIAGQPDLTVPLEIPVDVLKKAFIVHVHSHNSLFNLGIALKAKVLGTKIVTHFMAVDTLREHPSPVVRSLGPFYQSMITRTMLNLSDIVLAKSHRDLLLLRRRYKARPVYVPDGIGLHYFSEPSNPFLFRKRYHIHEDVILLFIGRLHPSKGPQTLISAIPYMLSEYRHVKVVFIGPGNQDWLKQLARRLGVQQYVLFAGVVNEMMKLSAIDASRCVIVPSMYDFVEVFSLVSSEAWARGKPVVATPVGELAYRVKNGVNGLLFYPGDAEGLGKALLKLGRTNFRINEKLYLWKDIAASLREIYMRAHHQGSFVQGPCS